MAYCITLRSRTDTRIITGWYADSASRWSTDHGRQKLFDNKYHAGAVCRELRNLCPRNPEVINIEVARDVSEETPRSGYSSIAIPYSVYAPDVTNEEADALPRAARSR